MKNNSDDTKNVAREQWLLPEAPSVLSGNISLDGALQGTLVWGNPDYIKQLFLTLLDNAFKYTPADGKVAMIGSLNEASITVTVADTGIGIPPADLPRIFDRFHRAENARFQSGAGLGLAIAQRIAEQHGGNIEVESVLQQGSRFIVTLPTL